MVLPIHAENIVIFAASSLKDAIDEIYAGQEIFVTYGGSGQLARQLEFGAQGDIFLSANPEWAEYVTENMDYIERQSLLSNALIFIGHDARLMADLEKYQDKPEQAAEIFEAALSQSIIALPNPDFVPAGQYAWEAMQSLGVNESALKTVIPTQNVRAALRLVELGEADFAFVYQSDIALTPEKFAKFLIPQSWYSPIDYDAVLLTEKGRTAYEALENSDEIFRKYGFIIHGE